MKNPPTLKLRRAMWEVDMLALWIVSAIVTIAAICIFIKNRSWRKKILKIWVRESSSDVLKLLDYARSKLITIDFVRFQKWEGGYEWNALILWKTIMISIDAQTGKVLPESHFLQKILLAHEICHMAQEKEYFEIKFSCKHFGGNPCLFLELANWKRTFGLLQKFSLFHNNEEINKFWNYVYLKPKSERFSLCLQKTKDGTCPKTAELNKILNQFPK